MLCSLYRSCPRCKGRSHLIEQDKFVDRWRSFRRPCQAILTRTFGKHSLQTIASGGRYLNETKLSLGHCEQFLAKCQVSPAAVRRNSITLTLTGSSVLRCLYNLCPNGHLSTRRPNTWVSGSSVISRRQSLPSTTNDQNFVAHHMYYLRPGKRGDSRGFVRYPTNLFWETRDTQIRTLAESHLDSIETN